MARLYHPRVKDSEHDHPDDEASLAVMYDAGWKLAPEPEAIPGHEPEPVTYEPVTTPSETPSLPPKSGAGSGSAAWVAYAKSLGVEVTDDMTRDDIIAAVEAYTD